MVAQAAGVVGGGDEAAAESVHLGQRADPAGVAEVVGEHAAGEAGAAGRLDGYELVIALAAQLFAHEGADESAEVAAAAGAADNHVGDDAVFVHGDLGLHADDALVQQHLVEHAAEHVAVALMGGGVLHGLADGAAERAGGVRVLGEDFAADLGAHAGAGGDGGAVGAHDLAAEGLLLIGALYHVDLAVQAQVRAGHGERGAPLAGAGLGGDALEALVLGVVGLGYGAVELVGARGVVALELVVDLGRGAELFLQAVGPDQRAGAVHLVEVLYLLRDGDLARGVVELLLHQLVAEDVAELLGRAGLACRGVEQGGGLDLHIGADIVPRPGHLRFGKINLVGDFVVGHGTLPPGLFLMKCSENKKLSQ